MKEKTAVFALEPEHILVISIALMVILILMAVFGVLIIAKIYLTTAIIFWGIAFISSPICSECKDNLLVKRRKEGFCCEKHGRIK